MSKEKKMSLISVVEKSSIWKRKRKVAESATWEKGGSRWAAAGRERGGSKSKATVAKEEISTKVIFLSRGRRPATGIKGRAKRLGEKVVES